MMNDACHVSLRWSDDEKDRLLFFFILRVVQISLDDTVFRKDHLRLKRNLVKSNPKAAVYEISHLPSFIFSLLCLEKQFRITSFVYHSIVWDTEIVWCLLAHYECKWMQNELRMQNVESTCWKNKIENNSAWESALYQSKWVKIKLKLNYFNFFTLCVLLLMHPNCFVGPI